MSMPYKSSWLVLAIVLLAGCIVIEKKSLVMVVPADSNEVFVYYSFEGMSVFAGPSDSLVQATKDLNALKEKKFTFFFTGAADSSFNKFCRFDDLRFYTDPSRKRTLCADRRMTIVDRQGFADRLNKDFNTGFTQTWMDLSAADIRGKITQMHLDTQKQENMKGAQDWGIGPLFKALQGVAELANCLDIDSIDKMKTAVKNDFQWFRFEDGTVQLVMPCTGELARKIVDNPQARDWEQKMEALVQPVKLQAHDEGVAIVIGKKGEAIRLDYSDDRAYRPADEAALATQAGSPKPITLDDGSQATAEKLIQQFIAEQKK